MAAPASRKLIIALAVIALAAHLAVAQPPTPVSTSPTASAATPTPTKTLAFEIVSVRPHGASPMGRMGCMTDSCTVANFTLHDIISMAYGVDNDKRLVGGPSWIGSSTFDIDAKLDPADVPATPLTFRQLADLLQPVLADRFKLKVHHESRVFPVYNITLAKGGSKLKPTGPPPPGQPALQFCQIMIKSAGFRSAHNCTMTDIAENLEHPSGRFVVDKTGLPGKFDWEFCYSNERTPEGDPNFNCPTVFTAVQEQLGLKLEPSNAPIDILVIDSAEQPTEN